MPPRWIAFVTLLWGLAGAGAAVAADAVPTDDPRAAWNADYVRARERLLAGDFAQAEELFRALVARAPDATSQAVASEQARLSGDWARRQLVLVRRADLGESALSAKAAGERTTDEIAVLYTNAVFYGLGTGGWVAALTEPTSAAGGILPALGFAGAAVTGVAIVDGHRPLGYGVAQTIVSGMYIGLEEGLTWTLWNQARTLHRDEWSGKTAASVVWGMTTAGAVAGGVIGTVRGTTPGRASLVGSAALWTGTVAGLVTGAVSPEDDAQDDRALLAAAVGVNAGAVVGAIAAGPVSPSIARVRFLDLGGLGGGILFGGLYLAGADRASHGRELMGALSLGMSLGLATAWVATARMPADRTEPEKPASPTATIRPTLIPAAGGAMIGVTGNL